MATLSDLNSRLDALAAELPQLIADYPDDGDFWMAFAGIADLIEDQAGEHEAHVRGRINAMLAEHGRTIALVE